MPEHRQEKRLVAELARLLGRAEEVRAEIREVRGESDIPEQSNEPADEQPARPQLRLIRGGKYAGAVIAVGILTALLWAAKRPRVSTAALAALGAAGVLGVLLPPGEPGPDRPPRAQTPAEPTTSSASPRPAPTSSGTPDRTDSPQPTGSTRPDRGVRETAESEPMSEQPEREQPPAPEQPPPETVTETETRTSTRPPPDDDDGGDGRDDKPDRPPKHGLCINSPHAAVCVHPKRIAAIPEHVLRDVVDRLGHRAIRP